MLSKSEEEKLYKEWREGIERRLKEKPDFAKWYSETFGAKPLSVDHKKPK
jgi:hypothetical protein